MTRHGLFDVEAETKVDADIEAVALRNREARNLNNLLSDDVADEEVQDEFEYQELTNSQIRDVFTKLVERGNVDELRRLLKLNRVFTLYILSYDESGFITQLLGVKQSLAVLRKWLVKSKNRPDEERITALYEYFRTGDAKSAKTEKRKRAVQRGEVTQKEVWQIEAAKRRGKAKREKQMADKSKLITAKKVAPVAFAEPTASDMDWSAKKGKEPSKSRGGRNRTTKRMERMNPRRQAKIAKQQLVIADFIPAPNVVALQPIVEPLVEEEKDLPISVQEIAEQVSEVIKIESDAYERIVVEQPAKIVVTYTKVCDERKYSDDDEEKSDSENEPDMPDELYDIYVGQLRSNNRVPDVSSLYVEDDFVVVNGERVVKRKVRKQVEKLQKKANNHKNSFHQVQKERLAKLDPSKAYQFVAEQDVERLGAYIDAHGFYRTKAAERKRLKNKSANKDLRAERKAAKEAKKDAKKIVKSMKPKKPKAKKPQKPKILTESGEGERSEIAGFVKEVIADGHCVNYVVPVAVCVYQLSRSRNIADGVAALLAFGKSIGLEKHLLSVHDRVTSFFNLNGTIDQLRKWKEAHLEREDEPILEQRMTESGIGEAVDMLQALAHTAATNEFIQGFVGLVLGMVSLKMFDKDRADSIKALVGSPRNLTMGAAIIAILTGLSVCDRFFGLLRGGKNLTQLLLDDDPLTSCRRKMSDLEVYTDYLTDDVPAEGYMLAADYGKELMQVVDTLSALSETTYFARRFELQNLIRKAKAMHSAFKRRQVAVIRPTPQGICLCGAPGIGKSLILDYVLGIWGVAKGRDFHASQVFTRVQTSDYWEGYNSEAHPYIHYSELGNESVTRARTAEPTMLKEIQSLIDSRAFPVDMAFGKKGEIFARPEVVVVDTNNEDMHIKYNMYSEAAMKRRFMYISVTVLPKYRQKGSMSIDAKKSHRAGGNVLNRYHWTVAYQTPIDNVNCRRETVIDTDDITIFTRELLALFTNFLVKQQKSSTIDVNYLLHSVLEDEKANWDENLEEEEEGSESDYDDLSDDEKSIRIDDPDEKFDTEAGHRERLFNARVRGLRRRLHVHEQGLRELVRERVFRTPELGVRLGDEDAPIQVGRRLDSPPPPVIEPLPEDFNDGWFRVILCIFARIVGTVSEFMCSMSLYAMYHIGNDSFVCVSWWRIMISLVFLVIYNIPFIPTLKLFWFLIWFFDPTYFVRRAYNDRKAVLVDSFDRACANIRQVGATQIEFISSSKGKVLRTLLCSGAVFTLLGLYLYKTSKNKKDGSSEATIFSREDPDTVSIHSVEELSNCGEGYARVKSNVHAAWNNIKSHEKLPLYCGDISSLYNAIQKNCRRVGLSMSGEETVSWTHILGIKSTFAIINKHAFRGHEKAFLTVDENSQFKREFSIDLSECEQVCDDVMLIELEGYSSFRDISMHFFAAPLAQASGYFKGEYCHMKPVSSITLTDKHVGDVFVSRPIMYKDKSHKPGDCGLPFLSEYGNGSYAVTGIHVGGSNTDHGFATVVTKEDLEKALIAFKTPYLPLNSFNGLGVVTQSMNMPMRKSPWRYEHLPHIDYYGHDGSTVFINQSSDLKHSVMWRMVDAIVENYCDAKIEEDYGRPPMKPFVTRDGVYVSPYNIALNKMNNTPPTLDKKVMSVVIDRFVEFILEGLGDISIAPITMECAINGVRNDAFISRVNVATAGGYGFPGGKRKYMPLMEDGFTREANEDVTREVVKILDAYTNKELACPIFTVALKDEPRLMEKVKKGKTRLFYMSNLAYLIVCRMYLGPFYSLMVEHSEKFCTAVGINMHTQGGKLYNRLHDFSPVGIEGDYGGFDISNPFGVARAAATVVSRVCEALGYNNFAMGMVNGALSDAMWPFLAMHGDIFSKPGMQPSGKYATAEDNSLRGVIMLMYAWYSNDDLKDDDFFGSVLPVTYGDDVMVAVKEDKIDMFNNITYQKAVMDLYNMEFTSASKDAIMQESLYIYDMSFLKRTTYRDSRFDTVMTKLSHESIAKAMKWRLPSRTISEESQMTATVASMLWELFFHIENADDFDKCRSDLIDQLVDAYNGEYEDELPKYQYIYDHIEPAVERFSEITSESAASSDAVVTRHESSLRERYLAMEFDLAPQKPSKPLPTHTVNTVLCGRTRGCASLIDLEAELQKEYDDLSKVVDSYDSLRGKSDRARRDFVRRVSTDDEKDEVLIDSFRRLSDLKVTLNLVESLRLRTESGEMDDGGMDHEVKMQNVAVDEGEPDDYSALPRFYGLQTGQDEILDLDEFFARPVEISAGQWVVGFPYTSKLNVWNTYFARPSVRAKLRNYAFFNATLNIRVVISGMNFHYGKLLVSYLPCWRRNTTWSTYGSASDTGIGRLMKINYLSQQEGSRIMCVRENAPVEMVLPYVATKPMARLFNDSLVVSGATNFTDINELGSLNLYSINDLQASTATPSNAFVRVYAYLTNVSLGAPTATHIEILTESDERKIGPIENAATSMLSVSKAAESVSFLAPYARASSMLFGGLKGIASHMGWSKPVLIRNPEYVSPQPYQNGSHGIGTDTCKRIGLDPLQELVVDPRVVASETDDMIFSDLCNRTTFLTTFIWGNSDGSMVAPIWKSKVTPFLDTIALGLLEQFHQPTAMSFVASPFLYWRADIVFEIEIVCSMFHRGKIAVYYEPNILQSTLIDADVELEKNFFKVVDIQDTQRFSICVRWASPRAWLKGQPHGTSVFSYGDYFDASLYGEGYVNGYIGIIPFTNLQSNDGSDVEINVYTRAENVHFNFLAEEHFPEERVVLTESGAMPHAPVQCDELNYSTATDDNISLFHFGEEPSSFRMCLKRYVTTYEDTIDRHTTDQKISADMNIFVAPEPQYGGGPASYLTLLGYLRYAYIGLRGGMRKRLRFLTPEDSTSQRVLISLGEPDTYAANSIVASVGQPQMRQKGTVAFALHTNAGVEVEIPFFTNNLFVFSCANDFFRVNPSGESEYEWMSRYYAEIDILEGNDDVRFVEESATAEDFNLMRFIGAPYYSSPRLF
jgi:hypothetical protein